MGEDKEERDSAQFDDSNLVWYLIQEDGDHSEEPVVWAFDDKYKLEKFVSGRLCADAAALLLGRRRITCKCGEVCRSYCIGWTYVRKEV